jgi:hypothetical protein
MTEQIVTYATSAGIIAALLIAWVFCVAYVYRDAGKRQELKPWQKLVWSFLALVPVLGIAAYVVTQVGNLRFPNRRPSTQAAPGIPLPTQPHTRVANPAAEEPETRPPGSLPFGGPEEHSVLRPDSTSPGGSRVTVPPTMGSYLETVGPGQIQGDAQLRMGENLLGAVWSAMKGNWILIEGDPSISAQHARIHVSANGMTLENLSRHSVTMLEGRPLKVQEVAPLVSGQKIKLGSTYLLVVAEAASVWDAPSAPGALTYSAPFTADHLLPLVIRAHSGPHRGETFAVHRLPALIGRHAQADVNLGRDPLVSRRHAELYAHANTLRIKNYGQHGTTVQGFQVQEKDLKEGDLAQGIRVRVGKSLLIISTGGGH